MRCFVHRDTEAVGLCRACGKGICPNCLVDHGHSVSCQGACERKAQTINLQLTQTERVLHSQKKNRFFLPAFFLAMGVAFMIFASDGKSLINLGTVIGSGFIVFGVILMVMMQRYAKDLDAKDTP